MHRAPTEIVLVLVLASLVLVSAPAIAQNPGGSPEGKKLKNPVAATPESIKAGQAFTVPSGVVHSAAAAGRVPTKLLATYIVEKGKPLRTAIRREMGSRVDRR